MAQFRIIKSGKTRRYQEVKTGRIISRYTYDKIKRKSTSAFFESGTTHRSVQAYIDPVDSFAYQDFIDVISRHRGKAFGVFMRWEVYDEETNKFRTVQTEIISLTRRSSEAVAEDLYFAANSKKRRPNSKLPQFKEEDEENEEDETLAVELVFVSRL